MTKQLVLSIVLVCYIGHVTGNTLAQGTLDQRVSELSKQISDGLTENQKRTIAVVEFSDLEGRVTNFGRFIAEELITKLYQTKKFKVIERQLLNKVISEQKLSLTGVIEQSAAQRLGKVLGVDAIASGTVTDLSKTLRVNARLIDTATGEIFGVASAEILKDESVIKLVGGANNTEDTSGVKSNNSPVSESLIKEVNAYGFLFRLRSCRILGRSVHCEFSITNNLSEDRELHMYVRYSDSSRMFDEFGNEYIADEWKSGLGSSTSSSISGITRVLVPRVTTRAWLGFEGVAPQAKTISLLRVSCNLGGRDFWHIDFRNISIVRP